MASWVEEVLDPGAVAAAYFGGGVVGGGQFAAGDDEVAAAEVVFGVPVGEVVEDAEELLAGVAVALEVLGQALLRAGGEAIEVGGDEAVLVAVVGVEGRLGGVGLGGDPVDADGVDPLRVEELTGDLQDALGRRGATEAARFGGAHTGDSSRVVRCVQFRSI